MARYIIVTSTNGIYHGKRNGLPMFINAFFSDVKIYKSRANAEKVIKSIRWSNPLHIEELEND